MARAKIIRLSDTDTLALGVIHWQLEVASGAGTRAVTGPGSHWHTGPGTDSELDSKIVKSKLSTLFMKLVVGRSQAILQLQSATVPVEPDPRLDQSQFTL